ncbi:MAG: NAD-dependent epimerase/dehydratase family protein [Candidatus Electronema sp. V4]|uniref:NAD-dependent epimerase/dehydratase family protein n=1 Tax=Candidatus Electronema sp. V4 TaxID=3454756 RepID=UPI0040554ADF
MAQALSQKKRSLGVLIGGSGLIGGTLAYYFKTQAPDDFDIRAPSSKKLSVRNAQDIIVYLKRARPDFVINAAMASLDSDAQLAFEVNYLGCVNLARACCALKIPYIHFSSAAVLPHGENLVEEDQLPLTPGLSNYAKSKLMAEKTLEHMMRHQGLDCTIIRVSIVYGEHDHKIQGFHRLLFAIADEAVPCLFTKRGVQHSYTSAAKIPHFVHHALLHREEFSGQTYHFADPEPVALDDLILTIRAYLEVKLPREIYVPYPVVLAGKFFLERIASVLNGFGITARLPPEYMFLKNVYLSQTLSVEKLRRSSFVDPSPEEDIYTRLPRLVIYYLTRWAHLNLITRFRDQFIGNELANDFLRHPDALLGSVHADSTAPWPALLQTDELADAVSEPADDGEADS